MGGEMIREGRARVDYLEDKDFMVVLQNGFTGETRNIPSVEDENFIFRIDPHQSKLVGFFFRKASVTFPQAVLDFKKCQMAMETKFYDVIEHVNDRTQVTKSQVEEFVSAGR